jgi:hypothetical protein
LRLCVKCFCLSRNYFTASFAVGQMMTPATRAFGRRKAFG